MKFLVLLFVMVQGFTPSWAVNVQGVSGSLVYSGEVDGKFNSLVYESKSGEVLRVFDDGLSFNYDAVSDFSNLSPDKAYSVVHFSESGDLSGDVGRQQELHIMYLCAFVRMSDGCVVSVETGAQCDGEWGESGLWRSSEKETNYNLSGRAPSADEAYKDYASKRKDLIQVSLPKILAYFPEGTTFDNLLACDPPHEANKKAYDNLLALFQLDGDAENFERLRSVMNATGALSTDETRFK